MAFALLLCADARAQAHALGAEVNQQIAQGAQLYAQHCAVCHGADGRDAVAFPRPIWGKGHDIGKFRTAKGLFDYLQLMMPFDDPAKVNDAQKTAIAAYMLYRNGTLTSAASLPTGGDGTAIQ
jgi:mono/diheme cytochrome c family protein